MSFNLLEAVKGYFNSGFIANAASTLGASENGISNALDTVLPTVVERITTESSTSQGAGQVLAAAAEAYRSGVLDNAGNVFNDGTSVDQGVAFAAIIFGGNSNFDSFINKTSAAAGIHQDAVVSLTGASTFIALAVIGQHAGDNNLGASGVSALLASTKKSLAGTAPVTTGDEHVVAPAAPHVAGTAHNYTDDQPDHTAGGVRWLTPLLLLAVLGFLAWWLVNSQSCSKMPAHGDGHNTAGTHDKKDTGTHHDHGTPAATPAQPVVKVDSTGLATYELGKDVEFDLGNGVKIMAAEHGFEAQLLDFIKHGTIDSVNKNANWLSMFDVQFKTGGNMYMGKAEAQVKNCAAILKAYPNVKIKLGGYTDNTGAADVNKRVSQQRADKVKADLLKWGVAAGQIVEAVGYGPEYPVCAANDTPECKARNRRVDCKVAAK